MDSSFEAVSLPATKPIKYNSAPNQTGQMGSLANRSTRKTRLGSCWEEEEDSC